MLSRRTATIAALLVLLALILTALLIPSNQKPFSSPTAIRANSTYLEAHGSGIEFPLIRNDILSSIAVERAGRSITINLPSQKIPSAHVAYGPITTLETDATNAIAMGDGSIRLAYIATATNPPVGKAGFNFSSSGRFYTPDLKPLPVNDLPARRQLIAQNLPSARFVFACSNIAEFHVLNFNAFDARTHFALSTARNFYRGSNSITFNTDLNLWHQTPIEVVGLIGTGPTQTYSLPLRAGAELIISGIALKLLAMVDGELETTTMLDSDGTNSTSLKIVSSRAPANFPGDVSLLLYCWPPSSLVPLDFEAVDHSGKIVLGQTRDITHQLTVVGFIGSAGNLQQIRVKHHPNVHRLIINLPELPGLPEQNRNLQNLFDVHVPYARLGTTMAMEQRVGHLAQMEVRYFPLKRANGPFFPDATNTSPDLLFRELETRLPSPYDKLIADPKANEIRVRRHFLSGVVNSAKRLFGIP